MKVVTIPEDRFAGSGLTFSHEDGSPVAKFSYPKAKESDPEIAVTVATDGTTLRFFPERSAAQSAVLVTLGIGAQ